MFVVAWAGPSLALAWMGGFSPPGMGVGLLVFFGGLLVLGTRPLVAQALRRPAVRQALVDAFIVRLIALLVFPVALVNDIVCGLLSLLAAEALVGYGEGFFETAIATFMEGLLLATEVALIATVAFGFRRMTGHPLQPLGMCVGCGYDLRGCPSERCPECGRWIEKRAA